jgi:acyl-CoA reductase-like NAD-dependent aldehyde dehydrogenase
MNEQVFSMTINGRAVPGSAKIDVVNPATGAVFAQAPDCAAAELDDAVAAARAAFPAWAAKPLAERQNLVRQMGQLLFAHADALKTILTREQGKPLADAASEVMVAGYWCVSLASIDIPLDVLDDNPARRVEISRVPLGVVGAIAPWNFPLALGFWKVAPALLAGNTLVLKPSPLTPLTTLHAAALLRDLLPPGVFNVVSGGDALGPMLTAHPGIDKISFTGSTETGRKVMRTAADTLKRVTLELGGNDPAIVLPDFNVEAAANALFWAAFGNSGQVCVAAKRLYIHESVYDKLSSALCEIARTVKVGPGEEEGTQLGPVQNQQQYDRVVGLIEDSRAQGHHFLTGGYIPQGQGYFLPPTLVDNPPDDARIVAEEQFGPVLPLLRYASVDDAIARANTGIYGLAASVWGTDLDAAKRVADRLDAGTVWINEAKALNPAVPFAGHKQSGIGVENGLNGILEFTSYKVITVPKAVAAAA